MTEAHGFETLAVHAGSGVDAATGAVNTPVYLSSTFQQDGVGRHRGYEYARSGNPTRASLEAAVATLEGAPFGYAFASGLAAEDAVLRLLRPGDAVILPDDAYGGTLRLARHVHEPTGIAVQTADLVDADEVDRVCRQLLRESPERGLLVWIETPTNPLLRVVDIAAIAKIGHRHGAVVVVDNTFATPWIQQPLALGADVVVHSTTKYLGGHSDVIGGFVATADRSTADRIAFVQNAVGGVPGPFDCFLVHRGLKTLPLRMARHCDNALAVVELLGHHGAVASVLHPSLPAHPGHDTARRQMRAFGGMVSMRLKGGEAAAVAVCERTELFTLAESLGAVESLIEHPARMTHASAKGTSNEVPADLVRLSVGVESVDDLVGDLRQALDSLDAP